LSVAYLQRSVLVRPRRVGPFYWQGPKVWQLVEYRAARWFRLYRQKTVADWEYAVGAFATRMSGNRKNTLRRFRMAKRETQPMMFYGLTCAKDYGREVLAHWRWLQRTSYVVNERARKIRASREARVSKERCTAWARIERAVGERRQLDHLTAKLKEEMRNVKHNGKNSQDAV